jgi:hypothetical protein
MRFSSVVAFLAAATAVFAQSNAGSITGIVTDSSGAAIPGVVIAITSTDTGVAYRTRSNESGIYVAASLAPGRYTIDVEAQGFKKRQIREITVETGQRLRMDIALEIGDVKEVVEVAAAAAPLQQESAEISDTIAAKEIANLPLQTRAPYGLLVLSAGVSAGGDDPSNLDYSANVSINGSRAYGNAFVVDGASTTHIGGIGERIGSIEAIHEFKILASTYSAEYGRTSGAVITFQVKSGSADYHGSLYEYHRNNALNAADWENNARGIKPAALIRNEFGGSIGGPVPGMNKKMFFFANYEGVRDRNPANKTRTIPDPAIRGGNFSGLPVVVNDPLTGAPFPNNIIPAARLDPAAVKFLALFPTPNTQGTLNTRYGISTNNWTLAGPATDYKNFGTARLDYNPTEKQKFFFTFSHVNEGPRDLLRDFYSVLNTVVGPRFRNIRRATFGYTRFLRPNLTNEFLAFSQRDPRKITPWYDDFDVTQELGIQKKIGTTLPTVSLSGGWGNYGNSQVQDWVHQPSGLSNITSWLRGRHTIKFGAQLYQNQFWYISAPNLSGTYSFNGEITGLGAAGRDNPVNALADLLLGSVKTAQIPITQIPINRFNYNLALFVNDDWKATNRLTLNLGLRYEFETRQAVKNNVYSRIDMNTGQLLVAGRNASANLNLNNDYVNFSPRIGVAYSVNDKTVVRTGFGVFHSNFWVDNDEMVAYPGWTGTQAFVDQGLGRAQPFRFSTGFPVEIVPALTDPLALFAESSVSRPLSVGSRTYDPNDSLPYNMQWNLSVQRQLPFRTVAEAAYVGSRSVHLSRTVPANNPPLESAPDIVIRRVPAQQLRPFPNLTGFNAGLYDATASYHSFQTKATRRFASGFSLDVNYTFSKNIDTASRTADSFQLPREYAHLEKAISSLDRTHIFSVGAVYELPFGRGKLLFSENRILSAIAGGFQINALYNAATGLPLTITQTNTNLVLNAQRPDAIDPSNLSGRVAEPVFEGAARRWLIAPGSPAFPFRHSSNTGIGNLGRNTSREPGFSNINIGVFRTFNITERIRFDFRAEGYNAFNHVNYLQPQSANIDNASYGITTAAAPARQIQIGGRISF